MIDNEEVLFEKFSDNLVLKPLPEMDRNLATQLMEATMLMLVVEDKDGTVTALRAACQKEAFNIRLDSCIQLADKLWEAVSRPGAFATSGAQRVKWLKDFKTEISEAVFDIYQTQLTEIGVKLADLVVTGQSLKPL